MSAASARWLLFCEAETDARYVQRWVDDLLERRGVDWVRDELAASRPQSLREWVAAPPASSPGWIDLHRHGAIAQGLRLAPWYGHFNGEPAEADAVMHVNILRIAKELIDRSDDDAPTAVVVVRDQDNQRDERAAGAFQAIQTSPLPPDFPIVVGLPAPEIEAWVAAGFVAANDRERNTLASLRSELGFAPHEQPHQLTSRNTTDKRDAKRVLATLTAADADREEQCLRIPDEEALARLKSRGRACGLADFLDQIETKLVPQVDPTAPSRIRR
jgi:hypothetical protein